MAVFTDTILLCSLVLLICTLLFIAKSLGFHKPNTKIRPPPSPPALPLIGHLHLIGSVIPRCFQNLARLYGPLMELHLGASTSIIVSNAQVASQIYKTHDLNFCSRPQFESFDNRKGSQFIFAPYGPYWRFMKKLCVNQLLSTTQLGRSTHIREQEVKKLLDSLMVCSREGEACDLSFNFTTLTNTVMCRMAMSTTCDAEEIYGLVKELMEVAGKISVGDVFGRLGKLDLFGYRRKLEKIMGKFDEIIERIMKEHEETLCEGEENRDMMDMLLRVHADPNAEVKLTRDDIKVFFLDLLLAGTDTTSVALQWAMAEIINHPQVLEKLKAEMNEIVGRNRLVKESDVQNLTYLQAVVKEVLRLHPSAPFSFRQSDQNCSINGYDVKGQTRTLINVYAIMRDPHEWVDPEDFIPERFLGEINGGGRGVMETKGQDYRYIPFGSGRRGCPGASLALTVIQITVAALTQCFDWKVKGGDRADVEEDSGFSMGLAKPLLCYPINRFDNLF